MKKILALFLVLLMVVTSIATLASCTETQTPGTTTSPTDAVTTEPDTGSDEVTTSKDSNTESVDSTEGTTESTGTESGETTDTTDTTDTSETTDEDTTETVAPPVNPDALYGNGADIAEAGIDWETVRANGFHDLWPRNTQFIEKAYEEGVLDTCDLHLTGMWRTGEILGGANAGHVYGIQDTDEEQVTKAFFRGREQVAQYEQYYKRYLKGFEHMECTGTGALLGVRESRRIMCDYVLTREDYMNRAVFEDEIGRYNYNIDIHPPTSSKEDYAQFEKDMKLEMGVGESYGIPYRSLTVKGIENLLVAGKCVSADHAMQASIRVMPGCFITGQAAGCAAAMTEGDGNVRKVDIKALQKNLKAIGAYLPNYKE